MTATDAGSPLDTADDPASQGVVERDLELAELEAALSAASRGAGGVITVEGGPGTGKSLLLGLAEKRGRAAGMAVLSARGAELEGDFEFGLAVRLLGPAVDRLDPDETRAVFSGFAEPAAGLFHAGGPQPEADPLRPPKLIRALRHLTANLVASLAAAGEQGLFLAIDDAQWSDTDSLRYLSHLAADLSSMPVLLVLAVQPVAGEASEILRRGIAALSGTRRLRLAALSEDGVARLVQRSYPQAPAGFVGVCARVTGGNPGYVRELLAAARRQGVGTDFEGTRRLADLLPPAVSDAVMLRLARLPGPAATMAAAVAVLGDQATLHLAGELASLDPPTAEHTAAALVDAAVLAVDGPLRFAEPLTSLAVYQAAPPLSRWRLHQRAAELLEASGAAPAVVATHLLACLPRGDTDTLRALSATARRASSVGEQVLAQRLLDAALAQPSPPELRPALLVDRALAHAATATPDALSHVRESLAVTADAGQRGDLFRSLARLLFARSEFAAATEAVEQALKQLPPGDPREAALLVESAAIASVAASDPPGTASGRLGEVLAAAQAGGWPDDPGLLALTAAAMLSAGRPAKEVAAAARQALTGIAVDDGLDGVLNGFAAVPLIAAGELDAASARAEACLREGSSAGSPIRVGMASHWAALARYHRGDLDAAVTAGQQALEVIEVGWDVCSGWVASVVAHAHMDRGDLEAASHALRAAERVGPDRPEQLLARTARAVLAQLAGDTRAAAEELLAVGPLIERAGIAPAAVVPWRSLAALAALQLGDTAEAQRLAGEDLDRARAFGEPRGLGIALRTAGIVRGGPTGIDLLARSVEVLGSSPAALELARSLVEYGSALRRDGQVSTSRDMTRRALELARTLGAAPLAGQAERELHAAGGRYRAAPARSGPAALTAAERQVAELAASGLSTRLVALELHLAPKTVDWHLGNVYRKLGIRTRRQLSATLAAADD